MSKDIADKIAIREIIENWVIFRDARLWDQFRTLWHKDGAMWATWFQGGYEAFIRISQEGFDKGARIHHMLGGTTMEIRKKRAVAQTKVVIMQRAPVEGVPCDVTCHGRIYDLMEKRKGQWGIVLRRHIYEKDRLDPLEPGKAVKLDKKLLASFPEGYRHLGYLQSQAGYKIKRDLPGLSGPELDALYAQGAAWLEGGKI